MDQTQRILVVVGLLVATGVLLINCVSIAREPTAWTDMRVLFPIVEQWWQGEDTLYPATEEGRREPAFPSYRYPPVWGVTMLPLVTSFELDTAIAIWGVLALAILLTGVVALMRHLGLDPLRPAGACALVVVAMFAPLYETFFGPTKELVMVGLTALALVLSDRRRPALAGLAFAGAVVLKIYPVFLGIYFLMQRRFRVVAWSAAWFLLLNLLPLPLIGVRDTFDFYVHILPYAGGSTALPENVGVEFMLMAGNWLTWFDHGLAQLELSAFNRTLATLWRFGVIAALLTAHHTLFRRGRLNDPRSRAAMFSAWVAGMLVLLPVCWANYQLFLLLPLTAAMALLFLDRDTPARGWAAGALLVSLLVLLTPLKALPLRYYVGSGLKGGSPLATTIGLEFDDEVRKRVHHRTRQLIAANRDAEFSSLPVAERRQALASAGVDNRRSSGADLVHLQRRIEQLERAGGVAELELVRLQWVPAMRRAGLTTSGLIRWMLLRPLFGVISFLAMLLVLVTLFRRPAPASDEG